MKNKTRYCYDSVSGVSIAYSPIPGDKFIVKLAITFFNPKDGFFVKKTARKILDALMAGEETGIVCFYNTKKLKTEQQLSLPVALTVLLSKIDDNSLSKTHSNKLSDFLNGFQYHYNTEFVKENNLKPWMVKQFYDTQVPKTVLVNENKKEYHAGNYLVKFFHFPKQRLSIGYITAQLDVPNYFSQSLGTVYNCHISRCHPNDVYSKTGAREELMKKFSKHVTPYAFISVSELNSHDLVNMLIDNKEVSGDVKRALIRVMNANG